MGIIKTQKHAKVWTACNKSFKKNTRS